MVGAPGATVAGHTGAGAVTVLYGSASGLKATHRKTITQATAGVPGIPEAYDHFGWSVASADLNKDGKPELVVGTPGEDNNSGGVWVLKGTSSGLTRSGSYALTAGALGFTGSPSVGAQLAP